MDIIITRRRNTGNGSPAVSSYSKLTVGIAVAMAVVSMQPWFSWNTIMGPVLAFLFVFLRIAKARDLFSTGTRLSLLTLTLFGFFYCHPFNSSAYHFFRTYLVYIAPIYFVVTFSHEEKVLFLRWFINVFCWILVVSIPFYILYAVGFSLPHKQIYHANPWYPPFYNYYFFTTSVYDYGFMGRFRGIYAEAGHLGMMTAILLYAYRFNIKNWRGVVMLLTVVLSFSLAGIILTISGYLLYLMLNHSGRFNFRPLLFLLVLWGGFIFLENNAGNSSNSLITRYIVGRLIYDQDKGIAGNNRNTDDFDLQYKQFCKTSEFWIGYSPDDDVHSSYGTGNSSYKVFVMNFGIVATVLIWLFCIAYIREEYSKLAIGLMVVLFLSFLQRPYILWASQIFTFICFTGIYATKPLRLRRR